MSDETYKGIHKTLTVGDINVDYRVAHETRDITITTTLRNTTLVLHGNAEDLQSADDAKTLYEAYSEVIRAIGDSAREALVDLMAKAIKAGLAGAAAEAATEAEAS